MNKEKIKEIIKAIIFVTVTCVAIQTSTLFLSTIIKDIPPDKVAPGYNTKMDHVTQF